MFHNGMSQFVDLLILPHNRGSLVLWDINFFWWQSVARVKGETMKALSGLQFLLLASVVECSLSSVIAELPTCAVRNSQLEKRCSNWRKTQLVCLERGIENSTCAATNQTCICLNASLQTDVAACVATSCTIKESLSKSLNPSALDMHLSSWYQSQKTSLRPPVVPQFGTRAGRITLYL